MENKITTSIQYQLSNGKLFQEVFGNWRKFNEELKKRTRKYAPMAIR